jgi:hypothetical protein
MTGLTTSDASKGLTESVGPVATLEAPKASPLSPMLEGETMLEAFLSKQRRWLAAGAAAPTHLHPAFLVPKSGSCSREAAIGLRRCLIIAHINGATGSQQRCGESSAAVLVTTSGV